jgi:RNA polymerase primary sigma factor
MIEYDNWLNDPTPENMAAILKVYEPAINAEIQRFSGPKPLLRSMARTRAVASVKSFNPTSGAHPKSWMITQLQPLARYGQQLRPVRAPEVAIRQAAEVNRVRTEMADKLGYDPDDNELADEVGLSVRRIKHIRNIVKPTMSESTLATPEDEDAIGGLPAISQPNPLNMAETMVYDSLSPRDKVIFDSKTGKNGKPVLSNQEIAKRLGVSPALISQRTQAIAMQVRQSAMRELG